MATMTHQIRVATWNVHEGIPVGGKSFGAEAQEQLISLISRERIDVLCLQEVDFDPAGNSYALDVIQSKSNLKFITKNVLSESSFFPSKCAGVAIASRFPLEKPRFKGLKNPRLVGQLDGNDITTFDKGFVSAIAATPGIAFRIVSLHVFPFHLFGHYASHQDFASIWLDLAAEISRLATCPLIVCGDFNTTERQLIMKWTKVSLARAIGNVPTYNDKSYDDILVSSDFRLQSSWTLENFSDHRLCLADLIFEV